MILASIFISFITIGCNDLVDEVTDDLTKQVQDAVSEAIDDTKENVKEKIDEIVPDIPKKDSEKIDKAVEWAEAWVGVEGEYIGQCHLFVCHALETGGISTENYRGSANTVYNNHQPDVKTNQLPPRGSMVLYILKSDQSTPHTALSIGGGQIIHNNTHSSTYSIVEVADYTPPYLVYRGWILLPE